MATRRHLIAYNWKLSVHLRAPVACALNSIGDGYNLQQKRSSGTTAAATTIGMEEESAEERPRLREILK